MKTVAIYARYSSDLQDKRSIDDQISMCKGRAAREGWFVYECYTDYAISGASMVRPGLQQMLQDARAGSFNTILTEALDRLSRDQADIATIYKRMQFAEVEIVTLSEGRVGIVDIGLRGTMNQLYLVETANKIRRGQHGRVKAGRFPAGIAYGYDLVKRFDSDGQPVTGERKINRYEASVVRRIFRDYAAGKSPREIAFALNKESVLSPHGKYWNPATIHGDRRRGRGLLNNELYIGVLSWNRNTWIKDPETGRRGYRLNADDEVVRTAVPKLRIIPQPLWLKVKERQRKQYVHKPARVDFWRREPRYIFAGLMRCGCCGARYTERRRNVYVCASFDLRGSCDNELRIHRKDLEDQLLDVLKGRLAGDPELCAIFCAEYARRLKDVRIERSEEVQHCRLELSELGVRRDAILKAEKEGHGSEVLRAELNRITARRSEIERGLATVYATEPDPGLARHYRVHVHGLVDSLYANRQHQNTHCDMLRSLISHIVLRPNKDNTALVLDVGGDVPRPRRRLGGKHRYKHRGVAAEGFEPPTKGL
jgi:site-specific DNA recombinase